ncbi:hypothetical protein NDU88_003564 [Pleurodeles waltl]|uniref:Uncharacterized protein n=1 Tax=Pleurodeles waltl TaxID=8319 RepID=A0AAV7UYT8_PLEWA|nr:hypothetical protein NDU88_003564 [Pleurodeles waltl]
MVIESGPPVSGHQAATLDTVIQATAASREALELMIDTVMTYVGLLQDDQRGLAEKVTTTECFLEEWCQRHKLMSSMVDRVKILDARAKDAENRA